MRRARLCTNFVPPSRERWIFGSSCHCIFCNLQEYKTRRKNNPVSGHHIINNLQTREFAFPFQFIPNGSEGLASNGDADGLLHEAYLAAGFGSLSSEEQNRNEVHPAPRFALSGVFVTVTGSDSLAFGTSFSSKSSTISSGFSSPVARVCRSAS
jgi:hypothetical protein